MKYYVKCQGNQIEVEENKFFEIIKFLKEYKVIHSIETQLEDHYLTLFSKTTYSFIASLVFTNIEPKMKAFTLIGYCKNHRDEEIKFCEIKIEADSIKEALSIYVDKFNINLDCTRIEIKEIENEEVKE